MQLEGIDRVAKAIGLDIDKVPEIVIDPSLPEEAAAQALPGHPIRLSPVLFSEFPHAVGHTIAHELMHVKQQEQFDSALAANLAYLAENELIGYDDNRFELEADEAGAKFGHLVRVIP